MATELLGAVKQLVVLLERWFTQSGIPPRPAELPYPLATKKPGLVTGHEYVAAMRHTDVIKASLPNFSALISDPLHPCAVEVMNALPQLADIAATMRDIRGYLSEAGRERIEYLWKKLFAMQLFSDVTVSCTSELGTPARLGIVLTLTPIGSQFLSDFATAGEEAQVVAQVLKPDQEEQEILDLIRSVGHRITTTSLLGEFSRRGNPKADSTTKAKLSSLVKKGLLTTRRSPKPSGYGLPEW